MKTPLLALFLFSACATPSLQKIDDTTTKTNATLTQLAQTLQVIHDAMPANDKNAAKLQQAVDGLSAATTAIQTFQTGVHASNPSADPSKPAGTMDMVNAALQALAALYILKKGGGKVAEVVTNHVLQSNADSTPPATKS